MKKILIQYLQYSTDTTNKVYSGQKKLAVLHSVPGNIMILGEGSRLYLRAPSIGLVPLLQQPGSQIREFNFQVLSAPSCFLFGTLQLWKS